MNKILIIGTPDQKNELVALANSVSDLGDVIVLTNEIALDNDGWALLAPFGEHRKSRAVRRYNASRNQDEIVTEHYVQIVDEESVDAVIANEQGSGVIGWLKRALIKRPIYNGHPDIKLYAPETVTMGNERLIPLGVNEGLRKTSRGLEFKPLLVPDGAKAVTEQGCKYPSALFLLKKTGRIRENGEIEVRPFSVASIGLTPHPNISGVDSLANARANKPAASEEQKTQADDTMKALLIGWLAAQGVALANDATEQSVFDAFQKHVGEKSTSLTALGNEKSNLAAAVASLTTERDAQKKRADDVALALANEQNAFKAERQARCEAVVDLHIGAGRIAVSERATKVNELTALANEKLTEAITALDKLPVKHAVSSQLGERKGNANPSTGAIALANEISERVKAGKTKSQALDEIIKEKPEIYRAYINEGGGAL